MPEEKPITYQFIFDRWSDGLKVVGAGNGAGVLATAASLQYFSSKPELLPRFDLREVQPREPA